MPLKPFCDNCRKEISFNEPQPYGILFYMPGEKFRPKQVEKMLCRECFIEFYTKAGFSWSETTKANGKDKN